MMEGLLADEGLLANEAEIRCVFAFDFKLDFESEFGFGFGLE
jgi:hypothetical protein